MKSVEMEQKFKNAIGNDYYRKIMFKICQKNLKSVCSKQEMESIMNSTLWKCIEKFKDNKNVKFSSYLYRSLENNTRRMYKKLQNQKNKEVPYIDSVHTKVYDIKTQIEAGDILNSLKEKNEEYYNILIQKYYYNYTNSEIGKLNGYGKECARKKIKKAIEMCRWIVYN